MAVARVIDVRSKNPPLHVRAIMGETAPKITDGYGGWELIERNKRVAVTEWKGGTPYKMQVPLLLNGWAEGEDGSNDHESVEDDRSALENMARRDGGNAEPPIINIRIPGSVPRTPDVDWVIESIEWGDELRRREDGERVRQWLTLNVVQYVKPDNIKLSKARRRNRRRRRRSSDRQIGPGGYYVVKAGDTLGSIAARQLNDSSRWRDIAKLNDIRDPSSIKVGQRLRMPSLEDRQGILEPAD